MDEPEWLFRTVSLFGTDNAKVAIKKKLLEEFNLHTIIRMPASVFAPYTSITTNILFFDKTKRPIQFGSIVWICRKATSIFPRPSQWKREHFDECVAWWNERKQIKDTDTDTYKAKDYTVLELTERGYDLDLCGYPTVEEEVLSPQKKPSGFSMKNGIRLMLELISA